jgi:8-oxo-dGTP diphosphatase
VSSSDESWSQIPRRHVGAGGPITNAQSDILIVEPTYKKTWEIPGGVVELNESPATACARECAEELGLTVVVGRLLVVDHQSLPGSGDSTMYIYDCGETDGQHIAHIASDELRSQRFAPAEEAIGLLGKRLGKRVRHAITARETGSVIELEQSDLRSA